MYNAVAASLHLLPSTLIQVNTLPLVVLLLFKISPSLLLPLPLVDFLNC